MIKPFFLNFKVQQMKEIIEGQLKQASEQMNQSEDFESTEVITHLQESLQTGEEDIVFAQDKLKTRTSSLCKEGLAFEVRIFITKNTIKYHNMHWE